MLVIRAGLRGILHLAITRRIENAPRLSVVVQAHVVRHGLHSDNVALISLRGCDGAKRWMSFSLLTMLKTNQVLQYNITLTMNKKDASSSM